MSRTTFFVRSFALVCAICLAAGLLASCAASSQQKTPAQLNREYMSNVNRISDEAAEDLAAFGDAVSKGDVAAMRLAAADASKTLEKISDLAAPEALAQVHEEYKAGVSDLSTALSDYIALFASVQNGAASAGAADDAAAADAQESEGAAGATEEAIAKVRDAYQSGIDHLSKADSMVAELAGGDAQAQDGAQDGQANGQGIADALGSAADSGATEQQQQ